MYFCSVDVCVFTYGNTVVRTSIKSSYGLRKFCIPTRLKSLGLKMFSFFIPNLLYLLSGYNEDNCYFRLARPSGDKFRGLERKKANYPSSHKIAAKPYSSIFHEIK